MYFNLDIWIWKKKKKEKTKPTVLRIWKLALFPFDEDILLFIVSLSNLQIHMQHLLQCQKFIGLVWNKHLALLRAKDCLCSPDSIWQPSPDKSSSSILSESTQFTTMKNIWYRFCWYIFCLKSSDSRHRQRGSLCLIGSKVQLKNK